MTLQSASRPRTPEALAAMVSTHRKLLIMSDYDGTLVPIRDRPELAQPGRELLELMTALARMTNINLAVVSGRELKNLKELLPVKGMILAGCHGSEINYPDGTGYYLKPEQTFTEALSKVAATARKCTENNQGFLVEVKKTAVALHYRLADPVIADNVIRTFSEAVRPSLAGYHLELLPGKKVLEIRSAKANKGTAARRMMAHYSETLPIYFGDDNTDEDAFRAVAKKGHGILVSTEAKKSFASQRLRETRDVLRFLQIILKRW